MNTEKTSVTIHGAPCGWKAYIQWGAAWFPKGSFMTLLSLPQCHAAFSMMPSALAWVDQGPISQCVIVTLITVAPPHLLLPPM